MSRIQDQHRELRFVADRLKLLVAAPTTTLGQERTRQVISHELSQFFEQLAEHFACEEENGYMHEVVHHRPELTPRVSRLEQEHADLAARVHGMVVDSSGEVNLDDLGGRLLDTLSRLDKHERAENELVQEMVVVDIGMGG